MSHIHPTQLDVAVRSSEHIFTILLSRVYQKKKILNTYFTYWNVQFDNIGIISWLTVTGSRHTSGSVSVPGTKFVEEKQKHILIYN